MGLKIEVGSVWDFHADGWWVCIPTNTLTDRAGNAVMGAGLAKDAKERFPDLPEYYGRALRARTAAIPRSTCVDLVPAHRLVLLATKWIPSQNSSLDLIEKGLWSMRTWLKGLEPRSETKVVVPPLGCGLGRRTWSEVSPIFNRCGIGSCSRTLIVAPAGFDLTL